MLWVNFAAWLTLFKSEQSSTSEEFNHTIQVKCEAFIFNHIYWAKKCKAVKENGNLSIKMALNLAHIIEILSKFLVSSFISHVLFLIQRGLALTEAFKNVQCSTTFGVNGFDPRWRNVFHLS